MKLTNMNIKIEDLATLKASNGHSHNHDHGHNRPVLAKFDMPGNDKDHEHNQPVSAGFKMPETQKSSQSFEPNMPRSFGFTIAYDSDEDYFAMGNT